MARLRGMAALAMAAALLTTGVAVAAPYPPPSSGSARVDPSRIRVGECAVFSGDGFAPGTSVAIGDNGAPAGSATANGNGEFSKQLCYTSEAKRGRHVLTGTGLAPDGSTLTVSATLIVQGVRQSASGQPGPAAEPSASADPGTTEPDVVLGPPQPAGGPIVPASGDNSGSRLLLLGITGLGFAALASLLLLLLARRRSRPAEDEVPA